MHDRSGLRLIHREWPWLGLICAAGLALRLQALGDHPLWNNELFSLYWVRNPFSYLWGRGFTIETNPPLYYSLLKIWIGCFGESEIALRLPSAIASALCLPLAYGAGTALANRRAGLWAASLLALAPNQVQMAQSVRCYALLSMLATALLLLLAVVARDEQAEPAGERWRFALYGVVPVSLALVYTHAIGAIVVASMNAPMLLLLARNRRWRAFARLSAANALTAVGALVCLLHMLRQSGSMNLAYLDTTTPMGWLCQIVIVVTGLRLGPAFFMPAIVGLSTLAVCAWRHRPAPRAEALLMQAPLLFLAAIVLLDHARPLMQFQILAWLAMPCCMLAGLLLARGVWPVAAFGLAMAMVSAAAVPGHLVGSLEPWRSLVRALPPPARGALVAVGPLTTPLGLIRYGALRPIDMLSTFKKETSQHVLAWQMGVTPVPIGRVAEAVGAGREVTLVLEPLDAQDRNLPDLLGRLPPPGRQSFGPLQIWRWNPSD